MHLYWLWDVHFLELVNQPFNLNKITEISVMNTNEQQEHIIYS